MDTMANSNDKVLSASETVKGAGLSGGMAHLARITGQNTRTLYNWFENKPKLFYIVLLGAVMEEANSKISNVRTGLEEVN